MRRFHPIRMRIIIAAGMLSVLSLGGCRNQQLALTNPFLAPDRVPPPATRTLLPGAAQPYYPGDPLPTLQSDAGSVSPAAEAASPEERAPAFVVADERSVVVPQDSDPLRFALPKTPPVIASTTPPPSSSLQVATNPPILSPTPSTVSMPAPSLPTEVVPSIHQEYQIQEYQIGDRPIQSAMWISPQLPSLQPPTANRRIASNVLASRNVVRPSLPANLPMERVEPSKFGVRLRPITVAPTETPHPRTPRIRLPGYTQGPQQPSFQQVAYSAATVPTFPAEAGVPQTVRITELPAAPSGAVALSQASTSGSPTLASQDGFRPRGRRPARAEPVQE